jgi:hypothetical protein
MCGVLNGMSQEKQTAKSKNASLCKENPGHVILKQLGSKNKEH